MGDAGKAEGGSLGPITLGRALAALRSAHGWTQAELAEVSGVDKAQISRYERDVDQPSFRTLRSLLEALQAGPDDLRELQDLLDRIVGGRRRSAASPPRLSPADLSVLSDLMGIGGAKESSRPSPPGDEEVDRVAREAGATVERMVRLHFARLDKAAR